jgi:hypothetical protein
MGSWSCIFPFNLISQALSCKKKVRHCSRTILSDTSTHLQPARFDSPIGKSLNELITNSLFLNIEIIKLIFKSSAKSNVKITGPSVSPFQSPYPSSISTDFPAPALSPTILSSHLNSMGKLTLIVAYNLAVFFESFSKL